MDNRFTDQSYWENYWNNYQYSKIPRKVAFKKFMPLFKNSKTFIEIGGFPGIYAAYFQKNGIGDVTVLDFHMNLDIIRKFEKRNNLPERTIKTIHADFFSYSSELKYDVVFSMGFIEHFQDTTDVIRRHVSLLSEKGQLLIVIPNFLGLNGFVQRKLDRQNYDAHNLKSMDIKRLKKISKELGLKDTHVDYLGRPMLWLEPKPENKNIRKMIKIASYASKVFSFKGKLLSPYIVIYGKK